MTRRYAYALLALGLLATIPWPLVPDEAVWFGVPVWAVVSFGVIVLYGTGLFALVGRAWSTSEDPGGDDA